MPLGGAGGVEAFLRARVQDATDGRDEAEGHDNVHVIDDRSDTVCQLPELDLEVWGRATVDHYPGFRPLTEEPPRGDAGWRIGVAHGHFAGADGSEFAEAGFCGGGAAENQAPDWPAEDVLASIDESLQMMMDEGPGGGHHDNILDPAWGKVGLSALVVNGRLYLTNDFSPKCD